MPHYAEPDEPDGEREREIAEYVAEHDKPKPWTVIGELADGDREQYRSALKSILLRGELRIHSSGGLLVDVTYADAESDSGE